MMKLRISRVFINHEDCTVSGLCETELPADVITYEPHEVDGFHYESAVINQGKLPRTEESLLSMLAAADVCPMDAYYIELEDGTILNVYDDIVQRKIGSKQVEWA